jgi:hypothetical protein
MAHPGQLFTPGNGHRGATKFGYVGERVPQGALLGYSGNTGNTHNKPHLHLSTASCDPWARGTANCPTLPMNFRNTDANPQVLLQGRSYTALPYQ